MLAVQPNDDGVLTVPAIKVPLVRKVGEVSSNKELVIRKNATKPTLILHVGPKKTGTTYLQLNLLGQKSIQRTLGRDGISIVTFSRKHFDSLIETCFQKPLDQQKCQNEEIWTVYLDTLLETAKTKTTLLHSTESFSKVPGNNFTRHRLRTLQEHFDVRVLLYYRRLIDWLPSMYKQRRKVEMYRSRSSTFKPYKTAMFPSTLPQYFHLWREANDSTHQGRDSLGSWEFYGGIFGNEATRVLQYDVEDIGVELLCNGLDVAFSACNRAKSMASGVRANVNDFLLMDEDLVIMQAYKTGLIAPTKKERIDRHSATLTLKRYWDENGTRVFLPKMCLQKTSQEWLWNRTLLSDVHLSSSTDNEESTRILRDEFQRKAPHSFCHVDPGAVLENETLRQFLTGCRFVVPGVDSVAGEPCP